MARKSSKATPVVISGVLYSEDHWTGTQVGSAAWFSFLAEDQTFYCDFGPASFTARSEIRRKKRFWYAFKKVDGRLRSRYIGLPSAVTVSRLSAVAGRFTR